MTVPRRHLIRPTQTQAVDQSRQIERLRQRLDKERTALARWQTKLKRSFNAVEKCQRKIARLERQLNQFGGPNGVR
jgi:lipid II:glycine glycyltransferase (peptidoglycan interpeptide bridge formation enzyme)